MWLMGRMYIVPCLAALGDFYSLFIIWMSILLDPVRSSLLEVEAKDWGGRQLPP